MHSQAHELRDHIARFLTDPEAWLTVHCPDPMVEIKLMHVAVLARPRRSLSPELRMVPRMTFGAPADERAATRAERMGFTPTARETVNPKTLGKVSIPLFEARFVNADEGLDWCLAALQDVYKIGDAWLWITDLHFENWPRPLPRPTQWPPAADH